jgi:predicted phosphate transport protein (TIGR00153 family)
MKKVSECVHLLPSLFSAIYAKNYSEAEKIGQQISDYEHEADLAKNDIRNHLPKTLFLPVDRNNLLEILTIQDNIADRSEDVAVLTSLKPLEKIESFAPLFDEFLQKNIAAFDQAHNIIKELHELLETSFGGVEAEKVRAMVEKVAFLENEVDILQRKLLKAFFKAEDEMSYSTFDLWQKIFEATASLSNLSEKLAFRIRLTLELK